MKVVIVGLGQFGRAAALAFARKGAETIAMDTDSEAVKRVQDEVDLAVSTDASDLENLRARGVEEADLFIAGIGDDFEAQILAIVHAKKLGVSRVIARANSPTHERALLAVGADEVLDPESNSAEALVLRVMSSLDGKHTRLTGGVRALETSAPERMIGKPLHDEVIAIFERHAVHLIGVIRGDGDNGPKCVTAPETLIEPSDDLLLVGEEARLETLIAEF